MKVLVTGSAGFIGSAVSKFLLDRGNEVIGIDNHNNYYDVSLKESRLGLIKNHSNYLHIRTDISHSDEILLLFEKHKPNRVINLAAQAGVRHSIKKPMDYIKSNLLGFANILEGCRKCEVEHLVYASSSSVYGANTVVPFSVKHNVDHPLNLYGATKKANELMAHSYSHLYKIPSTGLRFFTVYGPWGRPDMALQKFAKAIIDGEKIQIFNNGSHQRDFTYIDDIVDGIVKVLDKPPKVYFNSNTEKSQLLKSYVPWKIYNIGNNRPIKLMDYIEILEKNLGKKAPKEFLPRQPGDMLNTWADINELIDDFNYKPNTTINEGIAKFCKWFKDYYS
jgi:UDP-glucuronate 4-epimerase